MGTVSTSVVASVSTESEITGISLLFIDPRFSCFSTRGIDASG